MDHTYLSVLNGTMLIEAVQYRYVGQGAVQFIRFLVCYRK